MRKCPSLAEMKAGLWCLTFNEGLRSWIVTFRCMRQIDDYYMHILDPTTVETKGRTLTEAVLRFQIARPGERLYLFDEGEVFRRTQPELRTALEEITE